MTNLLPGSEVLLNGLLNNSIQAGVLVLLVLLAQRIFRRQLTSRWRFALWWVVLIRLILPFGPESALSVFNLWHPSIDIAGISPVTRTQPHDSDFGGEGKISYEPYSAPRNQIQIDEVIQRNESDELANAVTIVNPAPNPSHPTHLKMRHPASRVAFAFAVLWVTGAITLGICVLFQLIRFNRKLRQSACEADENLSRFLTQCQYEFGITRSIELLETDAVKSPALFGLFRLKLLFPKGFADHFTPSELRYIFLHELAHVKRCDLWLNWLVTFLQIVHWFNPLIWLGFARLRADRELACDELALVRAGEKVGTAYGETVIKLLEGASRPAAIPGLVGILEDKKQMRRRIQRIANFRPPGRWSALAILLIGIIALGTWTNAQSAKHSAPSPDAATNAVPKTETSSETPFAKLNTDSRGEGDVAGFRLDLIGEVYAKGGGPLPASVFIATAAPKTGTSTFCPSCYADCSKHSKADATGKFKIEALNPQLTFQVLAVAKGYKPKSISKIDPAEGPISIALERIESSDATPECSLRGRVVGPDEKPLQGAIVNVEGIQGTDGSGRWGSLPGIDPLAVTDEKGEFLITSKKPFEMMSVKVDARQLAPRTFNQLTSGTNRHTLTLTEGAMVTGRVISNGQPLSNVVVGISGKDRSSGEYVGHFEVGTDADGRFALMNLPPNTEYVLYGTMNSLREHGTLPARTLRIGKDGETTAAGDLVVERGHSLAGRIVLADGQPVPDKTRLLVSRNEAWDSMQLVLDEDGRFNETGIPSETISLSVRVNNYHASPQNKSLDSMNNFQLLGRVNQDITNLIYLLERGPAPRPNYNLGSTYEWPGDKPLRGAEGGIDHSHEWKIAGRVLDSETGKPISGFRVTPGELGNFDQLDWDSLHSVAGTNGSYALYVSKRFASPQLKVEADGYLPASMALPLRDATNVDFSITQGTGPQGIVWSPDGIPEIEATVVMIGRGMNEAAMNSKGELTTYGGNFGTRKTGSNGKFDFKPELGIRAIAAASSNGFALVSLESFATNPVIRLVPFGKISGALTNKSGPVANETLNILFADWNGFYKGINLNISARTDAAGHFEFARVPSGEIQIAFRKRLSLNRSEWTYEPLQKINLKPSSAIALNLELPDQPSLRNAPVNEPPEPKRIPGTEVKGVVLTPTGKPASNAEVAIQIEGIYLGLKRGALQTSGSHDHNILVHTGSDGGFTLPLYEKAIQIIATGTEGFAQVPIDQLKTSPQITLQKWGRIEGTFEVHGRPGTNEFLSLNNVYNPEQRLPLDLTSYRAPTDYEGRFLMECVPPGEYQITRRTPKGANSWVLYPVGSVTVDAGETSNVNLQANGRRVEGKISIAETNDAFDLKERQITIHSSRHELDARFAALKTQEEIKEFRASEEFRSAMKNLRSYSVTLTGDGHFKAEDVEPGSYEMLIYFESHEHTSSTLRPAITILSSTQKLIVPPSNNYEQVVQWGTIKFQRKSLPAPQAKTPTNERATEIHGTVILPNGKPVANAQVGIRIGMRPIMMNRSEAPPSLDTSGSEFMARTDENGQFILRNFENAKELVISHEEGFARTELNAATNGLLITLEPWSGIQGMLRVNNHPGSNEWVELEITNILGGLVLQNYQDQTYASGAFSIDHVPPGEYRLSRLVQQGEHSTSAHPLGSFTLKPGLMTQVSVGGNGIPIFGKLAFPRPTEAGTNLDFAASLESTSAPGSGFPVKVSFDGRFAGNDIPPGEYILNLRAMIPIAELPMPKNIRAWSFTSAPNKVIVPQLSQANGAGVDVGEFQLEPVKRSPKVGIKSPEL